MADSVPGNERLVHQGGLMRCCLLSIGANTEPTEVGSKMTCAYGDTPMIVGDDGAWKWDHE
jgi:hypothetical protein